MPEFAISENCDGRCTVIAPGLVVDDLSRELAEAFVAACQRACERTSRRATEAGHAHPRERGSAPRL
jgi:hypothetical protein